MELRERIIKPMLIMSTKYLLSKRVITWVSVLTLILSLLMYALGVIAERRVEECVRFMYQDNFIGAACIEWVTNELWDSINHIGLEDIALGLFLLSLLLFLLLKFENLANRKLHVLSHKD